MNIDHLTVVGLGSIGRRHVRLLRTIRPDIEITLVRSGHGKDYPEEDLADRTVSDIDQAIDAGVQGAIICSPATKHISEVSRFLAAGVHTLVEKPLAESSEAALPLIAGREEAGVICLVGYVFRYDQAAIHFKRLLSEEKVGALISARIECGSYLPDWRLDSDYRKSVSASTRLGGGVLLEVSHEFDLLHWFFGRVAQIFARLDYSNTLEIDTEDGVDAIVTTTDGLPISLHLDFNRRHSSRFCTAYGIDGEISLDLIQRQIEVKRVGGDVEVSSFDGPMDEMYIDQLHHFFRCMEKGDDPRIGVEEALETLRVIHAARKSSRDLASVAIN